MRLPLAASAQGVGFVLSAQASVPMGAVTRLVRDEPGRGPFWIQLTPLPDRGANAALPLLVGGGIRRGVDVLKALCLGADAVLVGRLQVMALAAGGAQGVAKMLRLMRDELEIAMILSGCRSAGEAGRALLAEVVNR